MKTVDINRAQADDITATLVGVKNGANRAMSGAINKTLPTIRSRATKRVAQELNLKQRTIREVMAIQKASANRPTGLVRVTKKPIPLIEYHPEQTDVGLSVTARLSKGEEQIPHAFIATVGSGHVGAFDRKIVGGPGADGRAGRLPIKELKGPTPEGVLEHAPAILAEVVAEGEKALEKNLASQVDRLLQRKKPE